MLPKNVQNVMDGCSRKGIRHKIIGMVGWRHWQPKEVGIQVGRQCLICSKQLEIWQLSSIAPSPVLPVVTGDLGGTVV